MADGAQTSGLSSLNESQRREVIEKAERYVRQTLESDSSGHDWWHIHRVRNNALQICKTEAADPFVVELAALLHDIADWKFHGGDAHAGSRVACKWLSENAVPQSVVASVGEIIDTVSYKGAGVKNEIKSLEGQVVQDADRLDAIGAMGIARAFAYGGHAGRAMYDPEISPTMHQSFEEYKNSKGHTINHFYEKLLLLKDRLNTPTAKRIAASRHEFMEQFLSRFYAEWNGEA